MIDYSSIIPSAITLLGSGGAWTFLNTRMSRRDQLRDAAEQRAMQKSAEQQSNMTNLRAMVVKLEAQIDAMGVEFPHPEWTKDPYTHEILDSNMACRRQFFMPAGVSDPTGRTFEAAGFLPEAMDRIGRADRDAMEFGAAIAICRPKINMQEMAFIKMVGETRGMRRHVIKGFAVPTTILFSGEIGVLATRIQDEQAARTAAPQQTPQAA